jgi:streptogramin lyase
VRALGGALLPFVLAFTLPACTPATSAARTAPAASTLTSVQHGHFTEFALPTANSGPGEITLGPDGDLWFTESSRQRIGRLTTSGVLTEFAVPHLNPHDYHLLQNDIPIGITTGPDGNMWFTVGGPNETGVVGRLTPSGHLTQFSVPSHFPGLFDITVGPDGNLWFAELRGKLGRITPTGAVTEISLATPGYELGYNPAFITTGSDGNLWFTEAYGQWVGRITPPGQITRFRGTAADSKGLAGGPRAIVAGPDGNLWFTVDFGNQIGRITPTGDMTFFSVPTPNSRPNRIAVGRDGNLWFTEDRGDKLGRITPGGQISEFALPTARSSPEGITMTPDGSVWFTELFGNAIGRFVP